MTKSNNFVASFESYIATANEELDALLGGNQTDNLVASFESYIATANEELNALLGDTCDDDDKTVDALLNKVKANVEKTCKTIEDCDGYLNIIKTEQTKFNETIAAMKSAAVDFKDGKIDKAKFGSIVKEKAADLKASYKALTGGEIDDDDSSIEDDEVKFIRDFLIGAKSIVNEKKASLSAASEGGNNCVTENDGDSDDDKDKASIGSFIKALDEMEVPANEASTAVMAAATLGVYVAYIAGIILLVRRQMKKDPEYAYLWKKDRSEDMKAAKAAIKKAKNAVRHKDYERAIDHYETAKKHYKTIMDEIKKVMPNKIADDRVIEKDGQPKMSFTEAKAGAINVCTQKIFACDNAIADIKDRIKKKKAKEARKNGKANESAITINKEIAKRIANAAKKATESLSDEAYLEIYTAAYESLNEQQPTADPEADLNDEAEKETDHLVDSIENLVEDAEIPFEDEDPALSPEDLEDDEDLDELVDEDEEE